MPNHRLVPLLVGLAAFVVYRTTLAPGLTWANAGTDGGDLVTAAAVWGVPHPPGYPTYTLLGHFFASLPFGSIAFNLNLMSAACAALAATLIAASVARPERTPREARRESKDAGAMIAGLTLAFGPMLWGQATIAEVHALNALFVAAIGFLAPPWSPSAPILSLRSKAVLGLLWGAGLGSSPTILALAPIVLPALWRGAKGRAAGIAALALGLCVYALIPLRVAAQPPINWGDARTPENFLWLISGGLYRGYALAAPVELVVQRLLSLPRLWFEQSGWLGAVWVVAGILATRRRALAPLASVALYALFAVTYNTTDSNLYLIPLWVISSGFLGRGLAATLDAQATRLRRVVVAGAAALIVGAMLIGGWLSHDLSHNRTAAVWAESTLAALPPGAIVITRTDAHTFSLWYYRLAEGRRRDVSIVDARLMGYDWYVPMLLAQGAAPILPDDRSERGLPDRLAAANPTRPVCDVVPASQDDSLPILQCE